MPATFLVEGLMRVRALLVVAVPVVIFRVLKAFLRGLGVRSRFFLALASSMRRGSVMRIISGKFPCSCSLV